jgi:hypothetical protein
MKRLGLSNGNVVERRTAGMSGSRFALAAPQDATNITHDRGRYHTQESWKGPLVSERKQLTADERDRLVERGAARTGVTHRGVLVPDRHAAEEDEPVRG